MKFVFHIIGAISLPEWTHFAECATADGAINRAKDYAADFADCRAVKGVAVYLCQESGGELIATVDNIKSVSVHDWRPDQQAIRGEKA